MKKRLIPPVILLVLILIGVGWWFLRAKPFLYAGTIEATEVTLSAGVAALIEAYSVQEGDLVKAGQELVKLSGEDLKLAWKLAESDYRRGLELRQSGSITQAVYDQLRTKRDQARLLVSWCTITAPLNGVVLHTYHEPGEWARPGVNLLTLGDLSKVWAFLYVPQPLLAKLSLQQTVAALLPEMPAEKLSGRIVLVRSEAEFTPKNVQTRDERTRLVYGVKVEFDNPKMLLKPGMTVEVKLPEIE